MVSAHRRNRGLAYDDNDDIGTCESKDPIKPSSSRNLRRRHNAAATSKTGESRKASPERKHEGESDVNGRTIARGESRGHGFPKSLTPFVHLRDTRAVDAELNAFKSASKEFKCRKEADVEGQQIQNRTITYERENSMHASFLTNDSGTDFNNFERVSDDSSRIIDKPASFNRIIEKPSSYKKGKTLQDPPSVSLVERSESFRKVRSTYDFESNDERVNSDESCQTDNNINDNNGTKIDPNSFYGKFQLSRRAVGRIVNNEYVQILILFLIILNGILIGMSTTKWVARNNYEQVVNYIDLTFLIVFTIEIAMQLYYYAFALFFDGWLVFDFIVVVISWVSFGISEDSDNDFQVLRAFRIFRITRLVTRVKPLRDLVLALGEVLPRMSAIMLFLVIVLYVFAVLFTEQFSEVPMSYNYFTTLHDSLLSCFQMMTMEWVEICRELQERQDVKYAWISIVFFVMLAGFIVFNLIVAVVVEAVSATEETVRHLDGIESNTPASKLAEAEERVDLLTAHLNEMMEQQEQIQSMLETMTGKLLHLETERMKAKYRETRLREEIHRRTDIQKKPDVGKSEEKQPNDAIKKISMKFLQKIEAQKAARMKEEEEAAAAAAVSASSSHESVAGQSAKKKKTSKSGLSRDGSGKSFGTSQSVNSIHSDPDRLESPIARSSVSFKKRAEGSIRGASGKTKSSVASKSSGKDESRGSEKSTDKRKQAIGNWKKLLAVQKDFDL